MSDPMIEVVAEPLRLYLETVFREPNLESLLTDLKFILCLTNNEAFMKWATDTEFDLFSLIQGNLDSGFINLDCIELVVQIHHNLLLCLDYSREFIDDPDKYPQFTRLEILTNCLFSIDLVEEKWMRNVVILSYLKPRGMTLNMTNLLFRINASLFNELEQKIVDANKVNRLLELMRKFCSNVFKSENETLIRQVLDLNLAKLIVRILRLTKNGDNFRFNLKEVLNMLSLFTVDDEVIEFFLDNSLATDIYQLIRGDKLVESSTIINVITLMIHFFRIKSYSFSKAMKMDFLAFLFKNYERTDDAEFKADLVVLMLEVYEMKEFRKMLKDEETLMELKFKTEITQLDDLIYNELEMYNPAKASNRPQKIQEGEFAWIEQFPLFKPDEMQNVGIVHEEIYQLHEREQKLKELDNESILIESKIKYVREFFKSTLEDYRKDVPAYYKV